MKFNKGQVAIYTLMLGIVIILFALAIAPSIKAVNDDARSANTEDHLGLDCSNSSISDFQKAQCVVTDISMPYWILGVIFIGGAVIISRLVTQ